MIKIITLYNSFFYLLFCANDWTDLIITSKLNPPLKYFMITLEHSLTTTSEGMKNHPKDQGVWVEGETGSKGSNSNIY